MKFSPRILVLLISSGLLFGCKATKGPKVTKTDAYDRVESIREEEEYVNKVQEKIKAEERVKQAPDPNYTPPKDLQAKNRYELPKITNADVTIIEYDMFMVSYDQSTLIPRWVAYTLTPEMTEGAAVRASVTEDPIFSGRQASLDDYRGSGWAKGSLASPNDFKSSETATEQSCYLTNCCPMKNSVNNGQWSSLDNQIKKWAQEFGKVYIVAGTIPGQKQNGTIGENEVLVPDAIFKAVLVGHGKQFSSIGFIIENKANKNTIPELAVPVSEIESRCGLTLFEALPSDIKDKVKSGFEAKDWGL